MHYCWLISLLWLLHLISKLSKWLLLLFQAYSWFFVIIVNPVPIFILSVKFYWLHILDPPSLLHILLFNSTNITFCIHLPCCTLCYTTLFLICVCVWWTILNPFFSIILMFFVLSNNFFKILPGSQWTLI